MVQAVAAAQGSSSGLARPAGPAEQDLPVEALMVQGHPPDGEPLLGGGAAVRAADL
jgi:hypothetical protein